MDINITKADRCQNIIVNQYQVLNFLKNLKHIRTNNSVYQLANCFKGFPAAIVGSGPSLEASFDTLREYQNRMLIVSTNSAFKVLVANNIQPHLVVGMDGQRDQHKCFDGIKDTDKVYGVFPISASPAFFEFPFYKKFTGFLQDFELGQTFLGDDFGPPLLRGGTITNLTIVVSYICGVRDILFFGLDMALPNGRKYAKDSGGILRDIDKQLVSVPGVNGEMVKTTLDFERSIPIIEMQASLLKERGVRFFNIDSHGALIKNMEHCSFSEWRQKHKHNKGRQINNLLRSQIPIPRMVNLEKNIEMLILDGKSFLDNTQVFPMRSLNELKGNLFLKIFLPEEQDEILSGNISDEKRQFALYVYHTIEELFSNF